jgi:hypothetical protein
MDTKVNGQIRQTAPIPPVGQIFAEDHDRGLYSNPAIPVSSQKDFTKVRFCTGRLSAVRLLDIVAWKSKGDSA